MRQITRRSVLTGGTAVAATTLTAISTLRSDPITLVPPPATSEPCPTSSVKDFLASARSQALSSQDRVALVDQAIKLLGDFYVHLPLKRALYGVNPLERLRLLRQRLHVLTDDPHFHAEMRDIFASLRDLHTVYYLPDPYTNANAWLPFKVEACIEDGRRKYIVSRVVDGWTHPTFGAGVEVLSFDGIPVERAADLQGRHGSTPAARQALGLARLCYRALFWEPPPEEDAVLVHYRARDREYEILIPWSVSTLPGTCDDTPGVCNEIEQMQRFRRFLYAPLDPCHPFGTPERITTSDGVFGYIRVFSFDKTLLAPPTDNKFVQVFKSLVMDLAADTKGLIVDVRDNGGGSTRASERILQYVTPKTKQIVPSRLYFRATPVTLHFCQLSSTSDLGGTPSGLQPWVASIEQALRGGGGFSAAFQYTSDTACNDQQRWSFPGPVIVVTSALSYSSAEFFAAGFQDHGGLILGIDETTGGGGAGVRLHDDLVGYFDGEPSPFVHLDRGGLSLAFRRSVRVGLGAGQEIEDAGVYRNRPYDMTRDDLLNGNRDLKREAARLLAQMT
jgi:C-terminal processing protease CtpA/Prc